MTSQTLPHAFGHNFLGNAPDWYKALIIVFLAVNPFLLLWFGPTITGWAFLIEFIITLAMALKCYPLQPGGLLALEAVVLGLVSPDTVYHETLKNFKVILLLMFMVAGIFFMKDLLLFIFSKVLLHIRNKSLLSLIFMLLAAFLSAFLDALTVVAVLISVGIGFYQVYHKVYSDIDKLDSGYENTRQNLDDFRRFLANLMMHGAVGTALGGVCTLVGEPQNLLIAETAKWDFVTFAVNVAPVSMPVLATGIIVCLILEKFNIIGYGAKLPKDVRHVLEDYDKEQQQQRTKNDTAKLIIQALAAVFLIVGLALHLAEVGLIGLTVIILLTSFNGIIEESRIGHAFEEALPFTALLVVFFVIVGVIEQQHLFHPITHYVLGMELQHQPAMFFIANGLLSMISDNVFVATVYIEQANQALLAGEITKEHFDKLAIAINTGTNIPSVATPNGQAAFLFLLTSALAPLLRLSYGRMVLYALPYTIALSAVGLFAVMHYI